MNTNGDNPNLMPVRPGEEVATINDLTRGLVKIDLHQIKSMRNIKTDNEVMTHIFMTNNDSYYIRGKSMHEVADEMGITLRPVA